MGECLNMRSFTTIDTYTVTGRGTAHVIHVGDTPPALREQVVLDGAIVTINGIERPIREGMTAVLVIPVKWACA